MQMKTILEALFPNELEYHIDNSMIRGSADTKLGKVEIIGTVDSAAMNQLIAMTLANEILDVIAKGQKTPIVFIVDTMGQDSSRADELLCLNRTFAHLASCVDLLRRSAHPNIAIVLGEAVSGGFLSYGLMANQVFAMQSSQVKVMDLNAMSRVTKIPLDKLKSLSQTSAIFAPGVENYYAMGAVDDIWKELDGHLVENALESQLIHIDDFLTDDRRQVAEERKGRLLCNEIVQSVLTA
ncbi:biotin-independent malonate decarboxylase subunit gamma [Psychrobacter sp. P2G3]|uniref:biotin-independent malonate decarboxylase subunit gamma n=1 Tax=Psychrobacter sp. P2G3 TaxID=1699622 RepID=UPI00078B4E86|nr:biotin-independent malonate decarboxylase subunit gamma [Psychrobacter sp. P2G3]AMN50267.1 malonate decarboxylase subunit gamma [Psychrobacter sp. P2G3]